MVYRYFELKRPQKIQWSIPPPQGAMSPPLNFFDYRTQDDDLDTEYQVWCWTFLLNFAFNISSSHINTRYSSQERYISVIVNRQCGSGESMYVVILGVRWGNPTPNFFSAKITIFQCFTDFPS